MVDGKELRRRVESRIAELPPGYISKKNIKGKIQYYRQWRENGKLKSKYIRADDVESIRKQIEERKALQERLKELQLRYPNEGENIVYETKIVYGDDLRQMIETVKGFKETRLFRQNRKIFARYRQNACMRSLRFEKNGKNNAVVTDYCRNV